MLWAFAMGVTIDMFSDTCGINAAAATCLAFFRTPILRLVTLRDLDEGFRPGIKSLGVAVFFRYILMASVLFCTLLLMIDTFTFFNLPVLILKIVTSSAMTMVCIFCVESIGGKR
jgi:hypothetical protein